MSWIELRRQKGTRRWWWTVAALNQICFCFFPPLNFMLLQNQKRQSETICEHLNDFPKTNETSSSGSGVWVTHEPNFIRLSRSAAAGQEPTPLRPSPTLSSCGISQRDTEAAALKQPDEDYLRTWSVEPFKCGSCRRISAIICRRPQLPLYFNHAFPGCFSLN